MKKISVLFVLMFLANLSFAQLATAFQVVIQGSAEEHVILIPGFSCSGDVWEATVDQLKDQYTCHILTMAGFAGVPSNEASDWKYWTNEIAEYIKVQNIKEATVVGHSLGGIMALELASSYPDRIKEIFVVDALPCLTALNNPTFKSNENVDCSAAINMMVNQSATQFEMMQKSTVGYMCTNTHMHAQIISWALQSDRATLGKLFCELSNLDLRNQLDQIKCPATILLEAPFKALEPVIAKQYAKLENVQLAFAPQGLHFIMYDAPEWYKAQVNDILLK